MLVTTDAKETSEKLLTGREVADRLLVTGLMVRRWLTSGRLKGLQWGAKRRAGASPQSRSPAARDRALPGRRRLTREETAL